MPSDASGNDDGVQASDVDIDACNFATILTHPQIKGHRGANKLLRWWGIFLIHSTSWCLGLRVSFVCLGCGVYGLGTDVGVVEDNESYLCSRLD